MAITDELREYANIATDRDIYAGARLCKIADRIDAEYRAALEKLAAQADRAEPDRAESEKGVSWKEEARTWERRCKELIVERDERYIELPVDADGVPIRIGDVLDEIAAATYPFVPARVVGYHECCGEVLPIVENDGEFQVIPEKVCHYTPPTVEDVLREFAEKVIDSQIPNVHPTYEEAIAEYAAKLRLAEEVDE